MSDLTTQILLVEDDFEIRDLIELHLRRDGFEVVAAENGPAALKAFSERAFHLVLLDWMLPDFSGIEIARHIRGHGSKSDVPILMITAKVEPTDIVAGLEAGADDYVTKPFDIGVLMARVRALLRRSKGAVNQANEGQLVVGGLRLDLASHKAYCRGEEIHLTISEFRLLEVLLQNTGRVFTRAALIREIQGEGVSVVDRAIDTHVFGLRKKLGGCGDVIETVRGVGYRAGIIE